MNANKRTQTDKINYHKQYSLTISKTSIMKHGQLISNRKKSIIKALTAIGISLILFLMTGFCSQLNAQKKGDPISVTFKSKITNQPLLLKAYSEDANGNELLLQEETIPKNGTRTLELEVGNFVYGELIGSNATTHKIYINGSENQSSRPLENIVQLDPKITFKDITENMKQDGKLERYYDIEPNFYGVDAHKFNARDVTMAFRIENPIFQDVSEQSVTYHRKAGKIMPKGFKTSPAAVTNTGKSNVQKYVGTRDFSNKWNAGLSASFPVSQDGSVMAKPSIGYGESNISKSRTENAYYLVEKEGQITDVLLNKENVFFHPEFIDGLEGILINAPNNKAEEAIHFIKTYGTHYAKKVTYGGMYSQYTVVTKSDYLKSQTKSLDLKLGVSKMSPGKQTTRKIGDDEASESLTTGSPESSEAGSVEGSFALVDKKETRDILTNSKTYYRAVGGTISGGNYTVDESDQTPIKVELIPITELIDAKILKSRLTVDQVVEIKKLLTVALTANLDTLPSPSFDDATRTISFQLEEILIREHRDDPNKGMDGTITAFVNGKNIISYQDQPSIGGVATLFSVSEAEAHQGINKDNQVFPVGVDRDPATRTWHHITQRAEPDGTFTPLTLQVIGNLRDHDNLSEWDNASPRGTSNFTIGKEMIQRLKVEFYSEEKVLGANVGWFEADVVIKVVQIPGSDSMDQLMSNNRSTGAGSTKEVALVDNISTTPLELGNLTESEFEKYSLALGSAPVDTNGGTKSSGGNNAGGSAESMTAEALKSALLSHDFEREPYDNSWHGGYFVELANGDIRWNNDSGTGWNTTPDWTNSILDATAGTSPYKDSPSGKEHKIVVEDNQLVGFMYMDELYKAKDGSRSIMAALVNNKFKKSDYQNAYHGGSFNKLDNGKIQWVNDAGVKWELEPDFKSNIMQVTSENNPYKDTKNGDFFKLIVENGKLTGIQYMNDIFLVQN